MNRIESAEVASQLDRSCSFREIPKRLFSRSTPVFCGKPGKARSVPRALGVLAVGLLTLPGFSDAASQELAVSTSIVRPSVVHNVELLPSQAASRIVAIGDYGFLGDKTATFLGDPLPEEFFSRHRSEALEKGFDYSAAVALQAARNTLLSKTSGTARGSLELRLNNLSRFESSVVVSVTEPKSTRTRNFVVPIEPWGIATASVLDLQEFETLYLVSSQPFEARLVASLESGLVIANEVEVKPPHQQVSRSPVQGLGAGYCGDRVELKTIEAENGGTVLAHFRRFQRPGQERSCPYPLDGDDGTPAYSLQVHYPNYGDVFHDDSGSAIYCPHPKCKIWGYATVQVQTGKLLHWRNHEDFWDGFDEVFFSGATGVARCAPTRPDLCFGPLDQFFLVY